MTVDPAVVTSIVVQPTSVTMPVQGTQQLKVTATWSDGTTSDVTSQASYTGYDSNIATVSSGLVTGVAVGSTNIDISYTDSTGNTVTATPVQVTVTPPAVVVYSDPGYTQPWTSSSTSTTAYIECSGLAPNAEYTLVYEDPVGSTVETDSGFTANSSGIFETTFSLTNYPGQTGTWTVILENANSVSVASTTFYVNA